MATFINDIQAALDSHLDSMDSTPIAWPNINYEPTTRTTYLRPRFLPVATEQASLGGSGKDVTDAIYQIDVVQPSDRAGLLCSIQSQTTSSEALF
jgi:hypothetical protein